MRCRPSIGPRGRCCGRSRRRSSSGRSSPRWPSLGNRVIAASKDKRIHALNRKTGEEVWSFLTQGRVDCSPVVVGKRVYVGSGDRNLYVLDLDKGSLIQKIELDGEVVGSPAVAGGCLVVGTLKGTVYCLGD